MENEEIDVNLSQSRVGSATRSQLAAVPKPTGPVIVSKGLIVGYKLPRERKRLTALRDISLTVNRGEFVVLVGPSGSGKTTFINAIAGLVEPWEGSIEVNDRPFKGPSSDHAMVFQDYALMPWRTVESNARIPFELQNREGVVVLSEADIRLGQFMPGPFGQRRIGKLV